MRRFKRENLNDKMNSLKRKKNTTRPNRKRDITENVMFLDIRIASTATVFFILITFSPLHFVPDYLGISLINGNDFLSLVVGSVSSILGIVISVILIRFELVKQRLGRQVNRYFLR